MLWTNGFITALIFKIATLNSVTSLKYKRYQGRLFSSKIIIPEPKVAYQQPLQYSNIYVPKPKHYIFPWAQNINGLPVRFHPSAFSHLDDDDIPPSNDFVDLTFRNELPKEISDNSLDSERKEGPVDDGKKSTDDEKKSNDNRKPDAGLRSKFVWKDRKGCKCSLMLAPVCVFYKRKFKTYSNHFCFMNCAPQEATVLYEGKCSAHLEFRDSADNVY